ncbi:MAG: 4-demethylwyosine synthase TYW1 [Methanocellales archaeon]|nr:4-demethylwyosine synthase TYW1 [Methanocellales archaeon]
MSSTLYALLKKQGYHFVGQHSAVKACLWLNKSLRNEGVCYKSKFYGISSHRCIQMTPTLRCNHRCIFCWRPIEMIVPKHEWDSPETIVDGCITAQMRLVSGYAGAPTTDLSRLEEAKHPKHAAISLAGEPTLYPFLAELIDEFHGRNMSTFLVTNGTHPETLANVKPTQLYVSLNAPDRETYTRVCNPIRDEWAKINDSLELLSALKTRTAIRITLVEGLNLKEPEKYARLVAKAEPDYVEVKAYMHLGFSRQRLPRSAMPSHSKVLDFARQFADASGYQIADDVEISRVVLLSEDGKVEKISLTSAE